MKTPPKNKLEGVCLTHRGFEDTCSTELRILGIKKPISESSWCRFAVSSLEDLCRIGYLSQSSIKTLALIEVVQGKTLNSIATKISKIDFSQWISQGMKFKVTYSSDPESSHSTMEACEVIGAAVAKAAKKAAPKVSLTEPDIIIHVHHTSLDWVVGVDLVGIDVSSRDYKLFMLSISPKGTVAFNLLLTAGYEGKGVLIDPFCNGGVIAIEAAALSAGKPIHCFRRNEFAFLKLPQFSNVDSQKFFDKIHKGVKKHESKINAFSESFKDIAAAKKNAKVADLNKEITFSRLEVDWLDTKFDKASIDFIVTIPPQASKANRELDVFKVYRELVSQADYALKREGKMVVMLRDDALMKKALENSVLKLQKSFIIHHGQAQQVVLIISRSKTTRG